MIFYGSNVKNLVALPLKPETIRDLEIVNKESLEKEVTTFIQTNKILPAYVTIILSNQLLFSKNFPPVTPQYSAEKLKEDIDAFLTYVPFQNPLNKTITTIKGTSVLVANGDMYIGLKQIFDANKFEVSSMIPLSLIAPHAGENFSASVGQLAQSKFDWIKQNGYVIVEPAQERSEATEEEYSEDDTKPKKTNRSFVMIGVVFMLIGVVSVLLLMQRNKKLPPPKLPTPTGVTAAIPTTAISILPSPSGASLSAIIKDDTTTIQILNGSGIPGQAEILRQGLQAVGFTNIQTGNSIVTLAKTLIVFSTRVSPETKNRIINAVKQEYSDVTTQDSDSVQSNVIITTSRPISPTPLP